MQHIHLDSTNNFTWWFHHFKGAYYCNVVIVTLFFLTLYLVCNSTYYAALALSGLCSLIGIIDQQKMRILNQPFLPGDLYFIRQALYIARLYLLPVSGLLLLIIASVIIILKIRKNFLHFPIPFRLRIYAGILYISASACIIYNFPSSIESLNRHYTITNEFWNQKSNYQKNGVLYSFIMNLVSLNVQKPDSYSPSKMESLFSPWGNDTIPLSTTHKTRPDVIIVLSESFWDITSTGAFQFPCDPLLHFHSLCQSNPSTKLISPTFGGNTCIAEFEVLTGFSHRFFPSGTMAYNQFITRPIPSLVRVFKENGYRTTGIHTFSRWFWNRDNVFRHLGFDTFITRETMAHPEKKGKFISDREFARQIIAAASSDTDPDFIFAISMQNHGPYDVKRYDSLSCEVSGISDPGIRTEVNTYVEGLVDADSSLKMLSHYIDTVHTPTLLFFFGDHLPGFIHAYNVPTLQSRITSDSLWAHTTPSVWYANFPLRQLSDSAISMCHLPLYITQQAGIATPVYYRLLDSIYTVMTPLENNRNSQIETNFINGFTTNDAGNLCLYDMLFGKRLSERFHHVITYHP